MQTPYDSVKDRENVQIYAKQLEVGLINSEGRIEEYNAVRKRYGVYGMYYTAELCMAIVHGEDLIFEIMDRHTGQLNDPVYTRVAVLSSNVEVLEKLAATGRVIGNKKTLIKLAHDERTVAWLKHNDVVPTGKFAAFVHKVFN